MSTVMRPVNYYPHYPRIITERTVHSLRFNSTQDCFVWCDDGGYGYYSDRNGLVRKENKYSIAHSEMINECTFVLVYFLNLTKVVFNINNVDHSTIQTFAPVLGLRFHNNKLLIIQKYHVLLYEYNNYNCNILEGIYINSDFSQCGLCEFKNNIFVYPENNRKIVTIMNVFEVPSVTQLELDQSNQVSRFTLNEHGNLLAVSFSRIQLICIWNIMNNHQIFKLMTNNIITTDINNINFSPDSKRLCCSSVNGEINIFDINITSRQMNNINFTTRVINAFSSFTTNTYSPTICKFLEANTVLTVSMNGIYKTITFSEASAVLLRYSVYLNHRPSGSRMV